MDHPIRTLNPKDFPPLLREINDPPHRLYLRGSLPGKHHTLLTIVGSRSYTSYGKQVTDHLIGGLRGHPISIVSGLALGIDSIAHKAALRANLHTIAIPGSGLDDTVIYPRSHRTLAHEILSAGGALLSEFEPQFEATPWCFVQRNRIVAGISHATLVIEADMKSGTLITARLATDYNRDVLTVPGSIFSRTSRGPHMLIRLGATPVTDSGDILEALGMERAPIAVEPADLADDERRILDILDEPLPKDEIIRRLSLDARSANICISMMELRGYVTDRNGLVTRLF